MLSYSRLLLRFTTAHDFWHERHQSGLAHSDDEELFGAGFEEAMVALENASKLHFRQGRWYPRLGAYPAQDVSLRALAGSRVALLKAADGCRLMEEVEGTSAPYRVRPGAIYLHQGESYLVHELDLDAGHAILKPVDVSYYTQPREINDVRIVRSLARTQTSATMATLGQVRVTQQVIGYRRVPQFREETLSWRTWNFLHRPSTRWGCGGRSHGAF